MSLNQSSSVGGAEYTKTYHKRNQWKNGPTLTNFPVASNPNANTVEDVSLKHDEYLLKLEERNRMKRQLLEQNEAERLQNQKEKGFNLYINGANTSRFDSQTATKALRKSQHQPSSRKNLKEFESSENAQRARTAPPKRKKWTQDNDIEIFTHRDGRLKFEGTEFQYKYSEDFNDEGSGEEDQDSGVQFTECSSGSLRVSESADCQDKEVVFDRNEVEILRQSLRLDEILRESIQENLFDDTPSDGELQDTTVGSSLVIDFSAKPKNEREVKVLKSTGARSEPRSYTPTGKFDRVYSGNLQKDSWGELEKSIEVSNTSAQRQELTKPYSDNDVLDVVEKFRKLGVDQRRMLLEALTAETKDSSVNSEPKTVQSARPAFNLSGSLSDEWIQGDEVELSKSMDAVKTVPENSRIECVQQNSEPLHSKVDIKTYRVDSRRLSSEKDRVSLQQLIQSQSLNSESQTSLPSDSIEVFERPMSQADRRSESRASTSSQFSTQDNLPSRSGSRQTCREVNQDSNFNKTQASRNFSDSNLAGKIQKVLCLKLISNWGDPAQIGMTGVEFLDKDERTIECLKCSVINAMDQSSDPAVLLNKKTKTTKSSNMWSCMYTKYPIELFFTLANAQDLRFIKLWNFNKSPKDLAKGVRRFEIKVDNRLVYSGELEKGCGNHIFEYDKTVVIDSSSDECTSSLPMSRSFVVSPDSSRTPKFSESPKEPNVPMHESEFGLNDDANAEFSLEELLNQSNGRNSSLSNKARFSPKKTAKNVTSRAKPLRKQFSKLSGIFDSLDLTTNEEIHYQPTPTSSSRQGKDSPNFEGNELDCNGRLDESWSHIFAFERARSGRKLSGERKKVEMPSDRHPSSLESISQLSLESYATPKVSACGDRQITQLQSDVDWDNFIIPELPKGCKVTFNILSTWGDKYYVGLNGIELFDDKGEKIKVAKIEADPADINVLPEYSKDPRVVSNLIDGVNNTRDDTHMWLAPFSANQNHYIFISFARKSTLAMLRLWNYNKSRVHSSRGAKLIQVFLDNVPIFHGEIQRAGELGENFKETFGDTIMFTMDANILSMVSENDEMFLNDWNESMNCDETARPMTAEGDDVRPITVASNQKPGFVDESTVFEREGSFDFTAQCEPRRKVERCSQVQFILAETWADAYYAGLTGLQLLDSDLKPIQVSADMLQANPSDLNSLPEYSKDVRTVDKLVDGHNITTDDRHMWLIPFTSGQKHSLTVNLPAGCKKVVGFDVWNYNKSWEDSFRGVKRIQVFLDDQEISPHGAGFTLRRAPGHTCYNFRQRIEFEKYSPFDPKDSGCPCGFVFTIMIQSSQNDLYYVGLDGIEFYDDERKKINVKTSQVDAYPRSVNELENVKADIRTPDKLVDGVNNARDGSHSWLAPIFPNVNNKIYFIFDQPQAVSHIRIWNYSKTTSRGVKEVAVLVDDLIQYQGVLKPAHNVARGILPGMDADVMFQTINLQDYNPDLTSDSQPDENVSLIMDNVKVQSTATGTNEAVNQKNRPKTCVPRK